MKDRIYYFTSGFLMAFVFTALLASVIGAVAARTSYEKGQTDYAKGIIKYQCDTLRTGELHCYELPNHKPD